MKIEINLASQPFRRDRPVIIASVAVGLVLTALLVMLVTLTMMERGDLKETRAAIDRLQKEDRTLAVEQSKWEAVLRRPQNAEVLERSVFLNALLYRKSISWTKIFADLEKTIPHNVRVISIRPWLNGRNAMALEMSVGAEQTESMLKFLMAMESSDVFGYAAVTTTQPPTQNEPLYRFRMNVQYAQKF